MYCYEVLYWDEAIAHFTIVFSAFLTMKSVRQVKYLKIVLYYNLKMKTNIYHMDPVFAEMFRRAI